MPALLLWVSANVRGKIAFDLTMPERDVNFGKWFFGESC
jgi:hypothetical protein